MNGFDFENDIIPFFIVFFSMLLALFVPLYFTFKKEIKRRREIEAYCKKNGFDYFKEAEDIPSSVYSFQLMQRAYGQKIDEIKGNRDGYDFYIFENLQGSGQHRQSETFCLFTNKNMDLPQFYLREKNTLTDSIGKVFGMEDIEFKETGFSTKFLLQGKSEESIREFFNENVRKVFIKFFVRNDKYEGQQNYFLLSVPGRLELNDKINLMYRAANILNNIFPKNPQD